MSTTTFLGCVNRILRSNAIIRGDTDTISTFNDTAHNASLNLAIVATQNELAYLISDRLIPSERKTSGTVTSVSGTRTYALASDFTRFYGIPHFYDSSGNRQIYEYPGGLERLQLDFYTYATDSGQVNWWYWEPTSSKKIGFYQVPSGSGTVYSYEYEGSVMISDSTDTLPFHNDEEDYMFIEMAGRRFKFMFEDVKNQADIVAILNNDQTYKSSKTALMNLIKGQNPRKGYAKVYY